MVALLLQVLAGASAGCCGIVLARLRQAIADGDVSMIQRGCLLMTFGGALVALLLGFAQIVAAQ